MPGTSITDILSPSVLVDIDNYQLLAKVVVEGFVAGMHRSLFHGTGSEFVQYRDYTPGDDLKYLDWKVLAKRDRLYTKVFEEETNMDCTLVLDASASMGYRGVNASCSKLRYAAMAVACLAYLASRQGDNIGFYCYADKLRAAMPAARPGTQLQRIFTSLQGIEPGGVANHETHLHYVAESLRPRGIFVFVSDCLEAEDTVPELLKAFRFTGKEAIVIQVLDRDETELPYSHNVRFRDSETNEEIATSPSAVRKDYQASMAAFLANLRDACHEIQADYLLATSDSSLGELLAAYLHRRGAVF
jgi:uncharacterized protein (DUF58 family)